MKRLTILLTLALVACGPRVSDKDKGGFSNENNSSPNGETNNGGTNNGEPNNGEPNNGDPNNTSPNNTNPNNITNPNNTNPNNTNPNNTNPNNTNPNNNNNNNVPDPVAQKCERVCDLLWGSCVSTRCSLSADVAAIVEDVRRGCLGIGGTASELCTARYQAEPDYRDLVETLYAENDCAGPELEVTHCATLGTDQCSCPIPNLGTPCTVDSQCDAGLLTAVCQPQSGSDTPGGQCLAGGCAFGDNPPESLVVGGSTLCGEEGICYVADATRSVCLERCDTNADCDRGVSGPNQSGYACNPLGTIDDPNGGGPEFLGYCDTACGTALPCPAGFACTNTGACLNECTFDSDCPLDFSCTGTNGDGVMHCQYTG